MIRSPTFADWKTAALDSSEVMQDSEAVSVLGQELHETRATCAEAQLNTTELEANSQLTKDLQEQLSRLTTEKAATEQRLQSKTAETQNSRLEQEVGHLKKSLADVTQLNSNKSQAQDDITKGLQTQLVKLPQEKDASDTALQSKHGDFQSAQDGTAASQASLSEMRRRCSERHQELSSWKDSLAEAHTTKISAIQAAKDRSDQLQQQLARRDTDLHGAEEQLVKLQKLFSDKCDEASEMKSAQQAQQVAELAAAKQVATRLAAHQELARGHYSEKVCDLQIATDRAHEPQEQFGRITIDLHEAKEQISELQMELAGKRDKVAEDMSAQLQKLAQKALACSAEQELAHRRQELSQDTGPSMRQLR
ncbi:hypothetical protein WJX77_008865 [Trebouxia sp. C0004]